ncbi:hypothetical protein ASA1KI_15300 [Opitutales bacterium ASA1]|uniref:serine hydrolase domain-containing protein n=1 Tax=Congregicoccus parvus TaxID=3081749 RepID=UPI002B291495|nr:hypothetical protein ASA1KI_15300 [Opitutales bacterium ASA1]
MPAFLDPRTSAVADRVRRGTPDSRVLAVVGAWIHLALVGLAQSDPTSAQVDTLMAPLVAEEHFAGAIVLMRHGEVVYQRGFGLANHEEDLAFTPETPTDGGSMAKTFTAAAVWWLVHEGRLDPDDLVARWLPEFPHRQTTLRHLLFHSNGLPAYYEWFDPHFAPDEVRTTAAMVRVVASQSPRPGFAPGERFEYSNLGYDVAAEVIERVVGRPFGDFLNERFFVPLGMRNSFLRPARLSEWSGPRTRGYRWRDGVREAFDVFDNEGFYGASNIWFSALDLGRWGNAMATGTAVPPAAFSAGLERSEVGGQPSPITGSSWYCDESGARGYYTGSLNAFHCFVYWDRERGESVAFVSNSALAPWRIIGLQRDLVAVLAGIPRGPAPKPAFLRFTKATWPTVVGTYATEDMSVTLVHVADRGMLLRVGDGLEFDVFPVGAEVVYVPGPDYWLAFSGESQPAAMHLESMFIDAVLRRLP